MKWWGGDLDGVEIDRIEIQPGIEIGEYRYNEVRSEIREQLMDVVIEQMHEIVASGYNEDDKGW